MFSTQYEVLSAIVGPAWTVVILTTVLLAAVFIGGYLVSDRPAATEKPHKNLTKEKEPRV